MNPRGNRKNGAGGENGHRFKYHEKLFLKGGLGVHSHRIFGINHYKDLEPSKCKFSVLAALFEHAFKVAGNNVIMDVPDSPYISAREIIHAIDDFQDDRYPERIVFKSGAADNVITVINRIRDDLQAAGFPRDLISTAKNGHSYRIETAAKNLKMIWEIDPRAKLGLKKRKPPEV
jgi:hypothetical protein